jgi:D-3-phosphoglycerate dehydrogenase
MLKIRTYNKISPLGLNLLPKDQYEVGPELNDPDAILLRSQKLHGEPLPESVLAIARAGAGVNNVPVDDCSKNGIVVFNTPGANANAVKELVLSGMLLSSRGIHNGIQFVKNLTNIKDKDEFAKTLESEKKTFAGSELAGKTLGVVGLGAIGSMVADAALALGMKVVGFDPALSVDSAWKLSSQIQKQESLAALMSASDFVSLHVPAMEATKNLINAEVLNSAKANTVVLNFARDAIVDSDAMIQALADNKVRLYVTDFPTPEMVSNDKILPMPHIGASTKEAEENCAVMAANQLRDYLENGNIVNSVNFPRIGMSRDTEFRITFSNVNQSGVLGNVLSILADHKINVVDMLNKSRGELAYNIIDIDANPSTEVLQAIRASDHVIALRVIN